MLKVFQIDNSDGWEVINAHPVIKSEWKLCENLRKVGTMADDPIVTYLALKPSKFLQLFKSANAQTI